MSEMRRSTRFREVASLLEEQAELRGVALVAGEAAELLAERLSAVARQLGVTERTALQRYVTEDFVAALAQTLGSHAASFREIAGQAEPVTLDTADAGRVIAALGMAVKLAAGHVEKTQADSLAVITDGADALVHIGVALRVSNGPARIQLGGHALVWTRGVLVQTIELLRSGRWDCSCGPHKRWPECGLVQSLTSDLGLAGGWLSPEAGQPGRES